MIKVVLDSNVYISAILFGGKAEKIRNLTKEGALEVFVSEAILVEIGDVLKKKFRWQNWQIVQVIDDIREFSTLVFPQKIVRVIKEDEADNRIVECALEGKVKYIVSGDKHLLSLKEHQEIMILSPADLITLMEEK